MNFQVWSFWYVGLACATAPLIIHLLNRQRYRTVYWAAMDFLREAMQRNRRMMQIRDLLLLLLRTVAVLLFGAALAQPFFSARDEEFDGSKPLHAVLVIDNSGSMGLEVDNQTLLKQAQTLATEFIERLPQGSRVSVIPACGSRFGYSPDPYTKEDAVDAVAKIEAVDRPASVAAAVNEAKKACETGPTLAKRVIFIGDQQIGNWRDVSSGQLADLPSLQFVDVSPMESDRQNTWISDFRLQDGLADVDTPATLIVELRHIGPSARRDVPVTLTVDGVEVASKTVTLEPGLGAREVSFEHAFNLYQPEPGKPVYVPVRVRLESDSLPLDDERHLVVPVVAGLPVVFVDQHADGDEDAAKSKFGETRHLRKLLAPVASRDDSQRQLVRIRHVTLDELDQSLLEDARLVVIAGVRSPGNKVGLLRDFVRQGGPLVIAAGADFDPGEWHDAAWLEGAGILPAPLKSELVGMLPDDARGPEELKPFFLSYDSLGHNDYFQIVDSSERDLRDLYAEPFFFRAVAADMSDDILVKLQIKEAQRLDEELALASDVRRRAEDWSQREARGGLTDEQKAARQADLDRLREIEPNWLLWRRGSGGTSELSADPADRKRQVNDLAEQTSPQVLARFAENNLPFLVERRIGEGTVMFCSSGVLSSWNTLPKTNAILIFDRILRGLIQATLPERNFDAQDRIALPVPSQEREVLITLLRPGQDQPEPLDVGFIGRDQRGVTIVNPLTRGLYRVRATRTANRDPNDTDAAEIAWEMPLSVSGPADESDLVSLSRQGFDDRGLGTNARWVSPREGDRIELSGRQIQGQNSWWWLILAIFGLLCFELALLGWPTWRAERAVRGPAPVASV